MQISKKQKNKIASLIKNTFVHTDTSILKEFYFSLLAILTKKTVRSLKQLRLYFALLDWCCENIPEQTLKLFRVYYINRQLLHLWCKASFKIESIAFDVEDFNQDQMNEYMDHIIPWLGNVVMRIDYKIMMENFERIA